MWFQPWFRFVDLHPSAFKKVHFPTLNLLRWCFSEGNDFWNLYTGVSNVGGWITYLKASSNLEQVFTVDVFLILLNHPSCHKAVGSLDVLTSNRQPRNSPGHTVLCPGRLNVKGSLCFRPKCCKLVWSKRRWMSSERPNQCSRSQNRSNAEAFNVPGPSNYT